MEVEGDRGRVMEVEGDRERVMEVEDDRGRGRLKKTWAGKVGER